MATTQLTTQPTYTHPGGTHSSADKIQTHLYIHAARERGGTNPTHLEHVEAEVNVQGPDKAAQHPHEPEDGVLPHPELVLGKIPLDVLLPKTQEKD